MPHFLFENATFIISFSYSSFPTILSTVFLLIRIISASEKNREIPMIGNVGTNTPIKEPSVPLHTRKSVFLALSERASTKARYAK